VKIFACDPGESIGWGRILFDEDSKRMSILGTGVEKIGSQPTKTCEFFREQTEDSDLFVVENYIVNPKVYGHTHQGDSGFALRQIGMLQMRAVELSKQIVLQMPTVKPPGYGFLGRKYVRGKKEQHGWDALAHATYYLVTVHGMQPLSH